MSASTKPALGRQIRGMRQLESKISNLQNQYQALFKERQQDITAFISILDLASLEDQLIIGGLCKGLHKPPYAKKVVMQSTL